MSIVSSEQNQQKALKIIPLGGLGEVGLNMMVFEYADTIFIVDAGIMFPEDYMLGIDIVVPNIEYIVQKKSKVAGIILTHAHEDHIGALPYLLKKINAPVFGTPFTLALVRQKLNDHGLAPSTDLFEISPGETVKTGPFELEFIRVSHSTVNGIGLAIKTPVGLIIHTGDFRISRTESSDTPTDVSTFAAYGEQGVLALLSDSTNAEKEGYTVSDRTIGKTLEKISTKSSGRIIVSLFSSNVARIQQMIDIAEAGNRKIVFNGKSIEFTVKTAIGLGYIKVPKGMEIDITEINEHYDNKVIMITTGSQGEPMSALARMASGSHRHINIKEGDTVILSSKFIPGNEKAIANIINHLFRKGADVIYEKISDIHVSGHAFREELKMMIDLTKPDFFIPIHGEFRHLVHHARLAEQAGILKENIFLAENGQVIEFDKDSGRINGSVETGRVLIDGKGIGDVGKSVLKERRILSKDGLVAVTLAFNEETGVIVYGPEIMSRGFVFPTETGHLLEDAKCVILEIVDEINIDVPDRVDIIRSQVETALRQYFKYSINRKPVILPFIMEI